MLKKFSASVIAGSLILLFSLAAIKLFPWKNINWGQVEIAQPKTITVIGEAKGQQKSQVARFTATVTRVNDDKQAAVNEVNQAMNQIINQLVIFGISENDIKTQNISINQQEDWYYDEEGRRKSRPGQWRVSNSLEITLRDVDRAYDLADLLTKSGATNVWGPNFYVDEITSLEGDLLNKALENAREKAKQLAEKEGKKLGDVINISESGVEIGQEIRPLEGAGGGGPIAPGSSRIKKTLVATFELRD